MQRLLTGLLQSLLFRDAQAAPALSLGSLSGTRLADWRSGLPVLKTFPGNALVRILENYRDQDICIFILIDGLNEFNEQGGGEDLFVEESKLASFLRLFQTRSDVKLRVASWPYQSFRMALMKITIVLS
jgi:hypothetical protein